MTALLVSVRDLAEAELAHRHGVDIIDLKEPHSGSLGRVPLQVAEQIAATIGTARLSLAMGELGDWQPDEFITWPLSSFDFAKIGLSGMRTHRWRDRWRMWKDSLPASLAPVAVAYVDAEKARAPGIDRVVMAALQENFRFVLLDTYCKDDGSLLDYLSWSDLARLSDDLASRSITLAVAGRLTRSELPALVSLQIPIVAVRGAACDQGRESSLSGEKLREIQTLVRRPTAKGESTEHDGARFQPSPTMPTPDSHGTGRQDTAACRTGPRSLTWP